MQVPGLDTATYTSTASVNDASNATAMQELTGVFNTFASNVTGAGQAAFLSGLAPADDSIDVLSAGELIHCLREQQCYSGACGAGWLACSDKHINARLQVGEGSLLFKTCACSWLATVFS
jgi:hypothetical protein